MTPKDPRDKIEQFVDPVQIVNPESTRCCFCDGSALVEHITGPCPYSPDGKHWTAAEASQTIETQREELAHYRTVEALRS